MLADRIPEIQAALVEAEVDGWFFAVFQGNDPISLDFLGLADRALVTRRCYYLVPRQGAPKKLSHVLEPAMLDHLPGTRRLPTWQSTARARRLVRDCRQSPRSTAQNEPLGLAPRRRHR
jgi:hypothetical protein